MAGLFASGSSQFIKNAAPPLVSTGYPCTMACWFNPTTLAAGSLFGFDSVSQSTFLEVTYASAGTLGIAVRVNGGASNSTSTAGVLVAGQWAFIVGRFISATNRRLDVLFQGGSTEHVQNAVSQAPDTMTVVALGARAVSTPTNFANGLIGEFWYTASDVQADGAALNDDLLRQLAYGGPFSVSSINPNLVEYRSLRNALTSDADDPDEVFVGPGGTSGGLRQTWTQSGGPTVGPHCPLPGSYAKPGQHQRTVIF